MKILILLIQILSLTVADYIYEGCEVKEIYGRKEMITTKEDVYRFLLAKKEAKKPIEITINEDTFSLEDNIPSGFMQVILTLSGELQLQFETESDGKGSRKFNKTGNFTGQEKIIFGKNLFYTENCTEGYPYVVLTKDSSEKFFPVAMGNGIEFLIIPTADVKMTFGTDSSKMDLCWDKTPDQVVLAEKGKSSDDCHHLPALSPKRFTYGDHQLQRREGDEITKVAFEATTRKEDVYVILCLKGCPELRISEDPDSSDCRDTGYIVMAVLLAIGTVLSISYNIYQWRQMSLKNQDEAKTEAADNSEDHYDTPDINGMSFHQSSSEPAKMGHLEHRHYANSVETIHDEYMTT